jgi:erythromycin esterase-like protein
MSLMNCDHKMMQRLEAEAVYGTLDSFYQTILTTAQYKKLILIGEATHGTMEFYRIRAEITKKLIEQGLCDAVAVEADWPDAYRVHRYVCNRSDDKEGQEALSDFERFPSWMWRNTEVLDFIEWLRSFNKSEKFAPPCGFYGMDLYSLNASIQAVITYLDQVDPIAGKAARERYACFGQFNNDPQSYGLATASGVLDHCEEEAVQQLMEIQQKARLYLERDGMFASDDYFSAQQNAEIVRKAEEYYRAMYRGHPNTWNLRDWHMFITLEKLENYLGLKAKRDMRIVVWAHNSHLGNASATEMAQRGEVNIGQLAKEKYGDECLNIGFSTARGTVTAASDWDGPLETKTVREPLPGSYEELFTSLKTREFALDLYKPEIAKALKEERLQRAIGVIYRPETERWSHYFHAELPRQFDFMIHIDETHALEALPTFPHERPGELDETYPYGL